MKIIRFEDIKGWQKARELSLMIYKITKKPKFNSDYALREQIRRAAISVLSNIAEGFARRTNKEFVNFLTIAHGSAAELQSQLYIALDESYITKEEFNNIYSLAEETSKLIQGFSNYLRNPERS